MAAEQGGRSSSSGLKILAAATAAAGAGAVSRANSTTLDLAQAGWDSVCCRRGVVGGGGVSCDSRLSSTSDQPTSEGRRQQRYVPGIVVASNPSSPGNQREHPAKADSQQAAQGLGGAGSRVRGRSGAVAAGRRRRNTFAWTPAGFRDSKEPNTEPRTSLQLKPTIVHDTY